MGKNYHTSFWSLGMLYNSLLNLFFLLEKTLPGCWRIIYQDQYNLLTLRYVVKQEASKLQKHMFACFIIVTIFSNLWKKSKEQFKYFSKWISFIQCTQICTLVDLKPANPINFFICISSSVSSSSDSFVVVVSKSEEIWQDLVFFTS